MEDQRWIDTVIAQLEGNLPQQQACACERRLIGAVAATPGGDQARYDAALQLHNNSRAKPFGTYELTLCEAAEAFLRAARDRAPIASRAIKLDSGSTFKMFQSPFLTGMPSIDRVVNSDDMELKESYSIDSVPAADRVTCLSVFWHAGARNIVHEFADGFVIQIRISAHSGLVEEVGKLYSLASLDEFKASFAKLAKNLLDNNAPMIYGPMQYSSETLLTEFGMAALLDTTQPRGWTPNLGCRTGLRPTGPGGPLQGLEAHTHVAALR